MGIRTPIPWLRTKQIMPHRLLLQISVLLESLPQNATKAREMNLAASCQQWAWMNLRLRSCSWGELKKPAKFIGTRRRLRH
jgi:hypothetical protein